jgi:hypothetical protein
VCYNALHSEHTVGTDWSPRRQNKRVHRCIRRVCRTLHHSCPSPHTSTTCRTCRRVANALPHCRAHWARGSAADWCVCARVCTHSFGEQSFEYAYEQVDHFGVGVFVDQMHTVAAHVRHQHIARVLVVSVVLCTILAKAEKGVRSEPASTTGRRTC